METKAFARVEVKTTPEGLFTALISTFNIADKVGDIVRPGAFNASIKNWQASGANVPVVYAHQSEDPDMLVGHVDPANLRETATGLEASGMLYLDEPNGQKVYRQLQRRALREWSFGYLINKHKPLKGGGRELFVVDLLELGPCVVGCGTTATLAVKTDTIAADDRFAAYRARLDRATRRLALDVARCR